MFESLVHYVMNGIQYLLRRKIDSASKKKHCVEPEYNGKSTSNQNGKLSSPNKNHNKTTDKIGMLQNIKNFFNIFKHIRQSIGN